MQEQSPVTQPAIVFAERFQGPPGMANGGFVAGTLAARRRSATVSLMRPVPMNRFLRIAQTNRGGELRHGNTVLATVQDGVPEIDLPSPISFEEARQCAERFPRDAVHPFPHCFVCGSARKTGDALRLLPGPTNDGRAVAAPWVPDPALCRATGGRSINEVPAALVWSALDCPGAWSVLIGSEPQPRPMVLGRICASVCEPLHEGGRYVVMGWHAGSERRKRFCGTAIYDDAGQVRAYASSTWIELAA